MNKNIDKEFLIWFAGFFEGEGCFSVLQRGAHKHTLLAVTQSNVNNGEQIIRLLKRKFGVGKVLKRTKNDYNPPRANRSDQWTWYLNDSQTILKVVESFLPYIRFKEKFYRPKVLELKRHFLKKCRICGKEFWKRNSSQVLCGSGLCKKLNKIPTAKKHYEKYKATIQKSKQKYYQANKERIKKKRKEYYIKNKERCFAYSKEWAQKNPKKRKEITRRYYIKHKNLQPNNIDEASMKWKMREGIHYAKKRGRNDL